MIYIGEVPPSSYSRTTFRELLHGCRILINAANAHIPQISIYKLDTNTLPQNRNRF